MGSGSGHTLDSPLPCGAPVDAGTRQTTAARPSRRGVGGGQDGGTQEGRTGRGRGRLARGEVSERREDVEDKLRWQGCMCMI